MPSILGSRTQTIKYPAGSIVVALISFAGDENTIREGDRLRSDHFEVVRNPQLFHVEGLTTAEIHELRQQRFPTTRE